VLACQERNAWSCNDTCREAFDPRFVRTFDQRAFDRFARFASVASNDDLRIGFAFGEVLGERKTDSGNGW